MLRIKGIGEVLDSTQSILILLSGMLPGKEHHDLHDQIVKYAMASVSCVMNACRNISDSRVFFQ